MNSKVGLVLLIVVSVAYSVTAQIPSFQLQDGDLLFQQAECGSFCEAINKVTEGIHGIDFNHVGIAFQNPKAEWIVLEAISAGVVETPLQDFLDKKRDESGKPKVAVGRLKKGDQFVIKSALAQKRRFIGKPYDAIFDIDNDRYYCSELVYFLFKDNKGNALFDLAPMTFKDPDTGETFYVWEEYYKKLGEPIPEGRPGLNPGGISMSDKLEIFFPYSRFE